MPNETTMEAAALQYAINILQERLDGLQGQTKAKIRPGYPGFRPPTAKKTPAKHTMSAEGRARIAAAQKKRWAEAKRAQKKGKAGATTSEGKGGGD